MPHLAACHRCQGFVADVARPCPHCDAEPPRWRRVARVLTTAVFGAVASMTLMACYGAMPDESYCGYEDPDCSCAWYGECDEDPCLDDIECLGGEYCAVDPYDATTSCEWGGWCTDDAACPSDMFCDLARGTCRPGDREPPPPPPPPPPSCTAELLCDEPEPSCAEGTQPAIDPTTGCYTGGCLTDQACAEEACGAHDETTCDADAACQPVYGGVNCSDPAGLPCSGSDAMCTCESFVFLRCAAAPPSESGEPA